MNASAPVTMRLAVAVPPIHVLWMPTRFHDRPQRHQAEEVVEQDEEERRHEERQVLARVVLAQHRCEHLVAQVHDIASIICAKRPLVM